MTHPARIISENPMEMQRIRIQQSVENVATVSDVESKERQLAMSEHRKVAK